MCTVTYIPTRYGVLITSNRDEKKQRSIAQPPARYRVNGYKLVFPKDQDAAGSWIAMQEAGRFAVLLNGAFKKHEPVYPYDRSRGLVFLDIVASNDMNMAFKDIPLHNIEPFTIILYQEGNLTENRWDGDQKYSRKLPDRQPHIWSSVTLYEENIICEREKWFREWQVDHPEPTARDIERFHLFGGKADEQNNFRMNRNGEMLTVSITCIEARSHEATMHYTDLLNETKTAFVISFTNVPQLYS